MDEAVTLNGFLCLNPTKPFAHSRSGYNLTIEIPDNVAAALTKRRLSLLLFLIDDTV